MKEKLLLIIFIFSTVSLIAQEEPNTGRAGQMYLYWGWNRSIYTESDIRFHGDDYDFTLADVEAKDRPTPFALDPYFYPGWFTLPQYNFRVGYFLSNHWELSFGMDHMKYVMRQNQYVNISGNINTSGSAYNGSYDNQPIQLTEDFLKFEHTDGLNYGNFELRRFGELLKIKYLTLNYTLGGGAGFLLPKTNTTLLSRDRYDEFHLAGFGIGIVGGINFSLFEHFFIQSEFKSGYINMPDIRTTANKADKAAQDFWFSQLNIVFGYRFNFKKMLL